MQSRLQSPPSGAEKVSGLEDKLAAFRAPANSSTSKGFAAGSVFAVAVPGLLANRLQELKGDSSCGRFGEIKSHGGIGISAACEILKEIPRERTAQAARLPTSKHLVLAESSGPGIGITDRGEARAAEKN